MAKRAKKSRSSRSRDRKLVAGRQRNKGRYTAEKAKKAGVRGKAVKKVVKTFDQMVKEAMGEVPDR